MITAQLVKELRDRTLAPMMDCKRALEQANGDIEAAIEIMRKSDQIKAEKKSGRTAAEGLIGVAVDDESNRACILETNCETDFVGRDENFVNFVNQAVALALRSQAADCAALSEQALANDQTLEKARAELVSKVGENVQLRRLAQVCAAENQCIGSYIHRGRIGVVVVLQGGDKALAKDIAMQVAANRPEVIAPEDVPEALVLKEKEIYSVQAQESGKPANIIEKMIEGRLRKFRDEISLLGQPFVKNPDITTGAVLKQAGATVISFIRFEVGEGIEKKVVNFAEEVMQQAQGSMK